MPNNVSAGVGFALPPNVQSNAKNLVTPGQIINAAVDPWGFLGDPYGVPTGEQQPQWQQLVCQRYGQPKPGENVLPLPGTALHSSDFEAALTTIAKNDPDWFQSQNLGPGPAGRNGKPTELEVHDAQYAKGIWQTVIKHAKELGTKGPDTEEQEEEEWIRGDAPGVGFVPPQGSQSNARNLQTPQQPMDLSVDPWGFLGDPYGVPTKAQQPEFQQGVHKRYGTPREGDITPEPGTSFHESDFEAALVAIVEHNPSWFKRKGFGPGPNGRNGKPTQLESHDAQYTDGISQQIIEHARDLQLARGGR